MQIFRIGDARHPIWDGTGAAMVGGRWNSPSQPVIYGSLSFAGAMLEILAHANIGRVPTTHQYVIADVPDAVAIERRPAADLPPGWDAADTAVARAFGDKWLRECRSAILLVPSIVARLEWNAVVNPRHGDATKLRIAAPQIVIWDERLYRLRAADASFKTSRPPRTRTRTKP